ncbi:MAG: hypothetical protein AB7I35_12830 [Ramlibacter sp.]
MAIETVSHTRSKGAAACAAKTEVLDRIDKINLDLGRAEGVLWMLSRTYGGEIGPEERPSQARICESIQYVDRLLSRILDTIGSAPGDGESYFAGNFFTEVSDARGVCSTLTAMIWADGLAISRTPDDIVCKLFDALLNSVRRAMAWLNKDCTGPGVAILFDGEKDHPGKENAEELH